MKRKILVTLVALAMIPLTLFLVMADQQPKTPAPENEPKVLPQVTVVSLETGTHQPTLTGYAQASPRYEMDLAAQVEGKITEISPLLDSGLSVKKDELLLNINDTAYRQSVAAAESSLAEVTVTLLQEERELAQARKDWNRAGLEGEPDSPLLLREPQRKAAQARVNEAQAALELARENLDRTQVRAPFDGVVISRNSTPGSYIQPGMTVARLYASDRVELRIPMPTHFWKNLPEDNDVKVKLYAHDNQGTWQGYLLRREQHLTAENRQRALIVAVDKPLEQHPPLLPGTFVTAEIPGAVIKDVLEVPSSALTRSGKLWYVGLDNCLVEFKSDVLFQYNDKLLVKAPEGMKRLRLLTNPLKSYLPGMQVKVNEELRHD